MHKVTCQTSIACFDQHTRFGGYYPCKHLKAGHQRPASETPFKWRFAGGLMADRHCILAEVDAIKTRRSATFDAEIRNNKTVEFC